MTKQETERDNLTYLSQFEISKQDIGGLIETVKICYGVDIVCKQGEATVFYRHANRWVEVAVKNGNVPYPREYLHCLHAFIYGYSKALLNNKEL
jgi:hypothetical protein